VGRKNDSEVRDRIFAGEKRSHPVNQRGKRLGFVAFVDPVEEDDAGNGEEDDVDEGLTFAVAVGLDEKYPDDQRAQHQPEPAPVFGREMSQVVNGTFRWHGLNGGFGDVRRGNARSKRARLFAIPGASEDAPGNSRLSSTLERIPFVDFQDFNPNLAGTMPLNYE
jgi:hypothetical protein